MSVPGQRPRIVSYRAPSETPVEKPYYVRATKKGGIPITLSKRPKGHMVTELSNVTGADALLRVLKPLVGAGGVAHAEEGKLELEGEHEARITRYLIEKDLVVGLSKSLKPQADIPPSKGASAVNAVPYVREAWTCVNCLTPNPGQNRSCVKCSTFRANTDNAIEMEKGKRQRREAVEENSKLKPKARSRSQSRSGVRVRKTLRQCPYDWHYCDGFHCDPDRELSSGDEGSDVEDSGLAYFIDKYRTKPCPILDDDKEMFASLLAQPARVGVKFSFAANPATADPDGLGW